MNGQSADAKALLAQEPNARCGTCTLSASDSRRQILTALRRSEETTSMGPDLVRPNFSSSDRHTFSRTHPPNGNLSPRGIATCASRPRVANFRGNEDARNVIRCALSVAKAGIRSHRRIHSVNIPGEYACEGKLRVSKSCFTQQREGQNEESVTGMDSHVRSRRDISQPQQRHWSRPCRSWPLRAFSW